MNIKNSLFLTVILTLFSINQIIAQVGINTENPKTTFEIKKISSNNPQGLLLPSLTQTEINNMSNPPEGTLVYNETEHCLHIFKSATGWECVEISKQSFAITYEGAQGIWVQDVVTDGENIVKFKITNNLEIDLTGLDLRNALKLPNITTSSHTIEAIGSYNNVTIGKNGGSRVFQYAIKNLKPTAPGDLTVQFSALGKETIANIQVQEKSAARAVQISFEGDYYANTELTTSNKLKLKITNYSNAERTNVDLSNAINLSGITGITIPSGQNANVTIPANNSVTFTYNLSGVPTTEGTLTASFIENQHVSGYVNSSEIIKPIPSGTVKIVSVEIEGVYVEGKIIDDTHFINVKVRNNGTTPVKNFDFSQALTLNNGSGLTVVSGQHTNVTITSGQTVTLKYKLNGTPSGNSLVATWQYSSIGTVSESEIITSELHVTPNSISSDDPNNSDSGNIYVSAGTGENWVVENASSLPTWLHLSATNGTGNSNITVTMNTHDTSEQKYVQLIIKRPSDGAIGKVLIAKPATNEIRVEGEELRKLNDFFSINGGVRTITLTGDYSTTNINIVQKPDWVSSITVNQPSGKMVITTTPRTTPGPELENIPFAFSYGPGGSYVYSGQLKIRQKAQKCPNTAPLAPTKLTPYIISKYSHQDGNNNYRNYVDKVLLLERNSPNDNFTDHKIEQEAAYYDLFPEFGGGKSYLYIVPRIGYCSAGSSHHYWEATIKILYRNRIDHSSENKQTWNMWNTHYYGMPIDTFISNGTNLGTRDYERLKVTEIDSNGVSTTKYYTLDDVPAGIIGACYCMEGRDENTPERP